MKRLARGELETRVMQVLWQRREYATPGVVHDVLRVDHDLAYTTVETVLGRLYTKGQVDRRREGRAYAYRPVMTRDEWAAHRMREILDAAGDRHAALTHFLEGMTARERAQLRRDLGKGTHR